MKNPRETIIEEFTEAKTALNKVLNRVRDQYAITNMDEDGDPIEWTLTDRPEGVISGYQIVPGTVFITAQDVPDNSFNNDHDRRGYILHAPDIDPDDQGAHFTIEEAMFAGLNHTENF